VNKVKKFVPSNEVPVSFTGKAISHLENQVEKQSAKGILFNVKESGCSGLKYLLELAFEIDNESKCFAITDNLNLYINAKIIEFIRGTEIDYVQEGVNHRLDFKNPNATASCGCGESFSVVKQS